MSRSRTEAPCRLSRAVTSAHQGGTAASERLMTGAYVRMITTGDRSCFNCIMHVLPSWIAAAQGAFALPDTALLDVQLEPGTAAPVAERLRAAGVPYALVTGYARRDLVDPVWQGVPHLPKPF